jgi:queuosine precursor transporter
MIGYLAFVAFAATIPAANWMIGNVGQCVPGGPCLVPVGFGLLAPSGVAMIGVALVLRDAVHRLLGWRWALGAIGVGAVLSAQLAPTALVVASVAAFVLSELADFAVYAPLHRKRLIAAVFLSGVAGTVVDSVVFLWLAFGSLDFLAGQILGKLWATLLAAVVLAATRSSWKEERT